MKAFFTAILLFSTSVCAAEEILPSWNDGAARDAIIDFVECSTKDGCTKYIEPEDRIAVFDNDGTLWSEQPVYFQLMFAIDRVKEMAKDHPEWKSEQPFQAVLENDIKALKSSGQEGLMKIIAVTHAGMSTDEFAEIVHNWIATAKHPQKNKLYKELVFQPMLELLQYLRENGFKTYIFSGGGIEFMRVFAEEVYGIPPEQVIGSSIVTKYELHDGVPVLIRQPKIDFIDDKEGKPISINKFLGKRPVAAFGNSDGDLQMLQWTTAGEGSRFGLIVHHTDSEREWAYDRESAIGQLDKAFTEAKAKGWTIVDMKQDWKSIFPEK
ncbi:HAD family hydrolase [Rubinisphaera sp.]|uniref:HAD family hydrolase n=1 Tax=Rubinisphaera sp. TaxID=2024857 RepID=UPI000C0DD105|nr:HAD family hydrolase [Rubinisphaera sp.]MBV12275.1 haloacid dehalogenase [Rubinisphaera sp.]HCS55288.1 haloacid dehalogenase [Planctomycetaceae bacterium]|tara:strand:+ start:1924 stop:2895 length:972 start_codon:yes stop_codon:yes gene_type:complete